MCTNNHYCVLAILFAPSSVYTVAAVVALVSGYMLLFRSRNTHKRIVAGDSKLNSFLATVSAIALRCVA